jgi:hypothetical protein
LQAGVKVKLFKNIQLSVVGYNLMNQDIRDATPSEFSIPDDISRSSRTVWIGIEGFF